jgi:glutamine synthetase type III
MQKKIVQTILSQDEYRRLTETVEKLDMSIREAVREAILKWTEEKSGIEPQDPIFNLTPISYGDKKASMKVDEIVYK